MSVVKLSIAQILGIETARVEMSYIKKIYKTNSKTMPKRKYKKQPSKKKKKKRVCVRTSPYPSLPKKRTDRKAGKLYFREKDQRIVKINNQFKPNLICDKDGCIKQAVKDGIPTHCIKHGGGVRCQEDGCDTTAFGDGIPTMWRKHGGEVSIPRMYVVS